MIMEKQFHTGKIQKTLLIKTSRKEIWRKISKIAKLDWVAGVDNTTYLSKKKSGIGAIRRITFDNKSVVEEHVVEWVNGTSFTYVATQGLPLRAYVATISLKSKGDSLTQVTWRSYLNSQKMSSVQFSEFLASMEMFYKESLQNLKKILE